MYFFELLLHFYSRQKPTAPTTEPFHVAVSTLQNFYANSQSSPLKEFDRTNLQKDYAFLRACAREYILSGKPFPEMCDHNATVAKSNGKPDVGLLWEFVKRLYSTSKRSNSNSEQRNAVTQNHLANLLITPSTNQHSSNWEDSNGNTDEDLLLNG